MADDSLRLCPFCHSVLNEEDAVCRNCGRRVDEDRSDPGRNDQNDFDGFDDFEEYEQTMRMSRDDVEKALQSPESVFFRKKPYADDKKFQKDKAESYEDVKDEDNASVAEEEIHPHDSKKTSEEPYEQTDRAETEESGAADQRPTEENGDGGTDVPQDDPQFRKPAFTEAQEKRLSALKKAALLHYRRKEWKKAVLLWSEALQLSPAETEIRELLRDARQKLNRKRTFSGIIVVFVILAASAAAFIISKPSKEGSPAIPIDIPASPTPEINTENQILSASPPPAAVKPSPFIEGNTATQVPVPAIQTSLPQPLESKTPRPVPTSLPVPTKLSSPDIKQTEMSSSDKRINDMLELAEEYIEKNYLMTPADTNAYRIFTEILEMSPDNPDALEGIARLAKKYKLLGDYWFRKGEYSKAEILYNRILKIEPADHIDQYAAYAEQQIQQCREFIEGIKSREDLVENLISRAKDRNAIHDFKTAFELLSQAQSIDPENFLVNKLMERYRVQAKALQRSEAPFYSLGFTGSTVFLYDENSESGLEFPDGIRVRKLHPQSPAAQSGLKHRDVIVRINDDLALTVERFKQLLSAEPVLLTVKRNGASLRLDLKPADYKDKMEKYLSQYAENFSILAEQRTGDRKKALQWFREHKESEVIPLLCRIYVRNSSWLWTKSLMSALNDFDAATVLFYALDMLVQQQLEQKEKEQLIKLIEKTDRRSSSGELPAQIKSLFKTRTLNTDDAVHLIGILREHKRVEALSWLKRVLQNKKQPLPVRFAAALTLHEIGGAAETAFLNDYVNEPGISRQLSEKIKQILD